MKTVLRGAIVAATAALCLAGGVSAASAGPAPATDSGPHVLFSRKVCAREITVRNIPTEGSSPVATLVGGTTVEVDDTYNGVWFHIYSPANGWVLAQYLCS
ncbi:SH3 domain-containing protein [Actinosynnema sp. NPDC020468]|uniref:SH3 domain-containing protein n=1 Tax=Actinosynnema sp. NPDC020468 TaxID=3154488 RepID=UPI0034046CC4